MRKIAVGFYSELPPNYIMPIFAELPTPAITNIITADSKEWAQPNIFGLQTWSAINAVCPESGGGVCSGTLNGWSMDGWTWASVDEVNALFNVYLPGTPLGPGPSSFTDVWDSSWGDAFFAVGWQPTEAFPDVERLLGWVRTTAASPTTEGHYAELRNVLFDGDDDAAETDNTSLKLNTLSSAYFFRIP